MTKVYVCVGSSCHLKGSYDIITKLKELIATENADVELNASFCLGKCAEGVAVKVNDEIFTGITAENVEEFWRTHVVA